MNPNANTVGNARQWSEADIARLIGLDENDNPNGAVLVTVINDAGRYPELFAAITASKLVDDT
jgi:hypothetical protein